MPSFTAYDIFVLEYGEKPGVNAMTPFILSREIYHMGGDLWRAVELSSGAEGVRFAGDIAYGVTVVDYNALYKTTERRRDLSDMFFGPRSEVEAYIKKITTVEEEDNDE